jgi:DNA-directed RNA polymerase specialized sigma24 family protein
MAEHNQDGEVSQPPIRTEQSTVDFGWLHPRSPFFPMLFPHLAGTASPDVAMTAAVHDLQEWAFMKLRCWKIADREQHGDIFGEFLLRLANPAVLGRYVPGRARPRTFLSGVLWHVAMEYGRRNAQVLPETIRELPPSQDYDPAVRLERKDRMERFAKEFGALPDDERELILWRHGDRFQRMDMTQADRAREQVRRSRSLTRIRRYGEDGRWGRHESL